MSFIQIVTTTDKKAVADKITNSLLNKKLAGCIQVMPVTSSYWWQGKKAKAKEFMLFIKTKKSLYNKVEQEIKKVHNYSVPEILAMPITAGNKKYLNWLQSETK
jgi:periplasmic divalent cation tolerance protein